MTYKALTQLVILLVFVSIQCRGFSLQMNAAERREGVVRKYFDGVNKKDPDQIRSCFAPKTTIRDVCSINQSTRTATPDDLAERCMDFLGAHPDTEVDFYYGPQCGRDSNWVIAHWYETGTWSGFSCGLEPTGNPMAVEGQTRFLVSDEFLITDMVVTRTFTEWEDTLTKSKAL